MCYNEMSIVSPCQGRGCLSFCVGGVWPMEWILSGVGLLLMALAIVTIRLPFWKTDLQKILVLLLVPGVCLGIPMSIYAVATGNQPPQVSTWVVLVSVWVLLIGGLGGWLVWSLRRYKKTLSPQKQGEMIRQMDPSKIARALMIFLFIPLYNAGCIGNILLIVILGRKETAIIVLLAVTEVLMTAFCVWCFRLTGKNLAQPEQKAQAIVLEKNYREGRSGRNSAIAYEATFGLADGTKLTLDLYVTAYERLCVNSSGVLYYKARGPRNGFWDLPHRPYLQRNNCGRYTACMTKYNESCKRRNDGIWVGGVLMTAQQSANVDFWP